LLKALYLFPFLKDASPTQGCDQARGMTDYSGKFSGRQVNGCPPIARGQCNESNILGLRRGHVADPVGAAMSLAFY
jgi:hypothetical protein